MTTYLQSKPLFSFVPILAFVRAQLSGYVRNWRSMAPTLFTPMLLLVLFTFTGDQDGASMVPFVVGFTVMFSGQTLAQVLISWRINRVFVRFAATPTPTSHLLLATVITQVIIFVLQSILVMITGMLMNDLRVDALSFVFIIVILAVSCTTFLSFGAVIAAFIKKVETASMLYTFILLPMIFLGNDVFDIPGFDEIGQFLPTALVTDLLNPYFGFGEVQLAEVTISLILLLFYALVLTTVASRFFKTDG